VSLSAGHPRVHRAASDGSINSAGLGPHFSKLPREILHELFAYLPMPDVGTMALVSNDMRSVVKEWISSSRALERTQNGTSSKGEGVQQNVLQQQRGVAEILETLLCDDDHSDPGKTKLHPFALLCKRITPLQNTRERLRYAFQMFSKSIDYHRGRGVWGARRHQLKKATGPLNKDWELTEDTIRFINMLHTYVRGWDDNEYPIILRELDHKFRLTQKLTKVMACSNREEACLASEMEIRLYTRCLAWDLAGKDYGYRANWVLAIMDFFVGTPFVATPRLSIPMPLHRVAKGQATLFTLMFGPPCRDTQGHHGPGGDKVPGVPLTPDQRVLVTELNNHTDWSAFVEEEALDFHEGKAMFYGLAQAICSCLTASPSWKSQYACAVVDALFDTPRPWLRQNAAGFLLFCSEALILHYFQTKLDSKRAGCEEDVTLRLAEMIYCSQKFDNELSHERGIGKVFDTIFERQANIQGNGAQRFMQLMWTNMTEVVSQAEDEASQDNLDFPNPIEVLKFFGMHVMDTAAKVFQTAAEKETASACAKMEFEKKCAEVPMSSQGSETPAAAASMKSSPLKHRHDHIEDEIELEEMQQPAFKKAKMDQEPALGELKPLDPGMEWEKVSLSLSDDDSSDEENNNQDSEDEEYEGMENMQIED